MTIPSRAPTITVAMLVAITRISSLASAFTFSLQTSQRTKHPQIQKWNNLNDNSNNPFNAVASIAPPPLVSTNRMYRLQLQLQPTHWHHGGFVPSSNPSLNVFKKLFPPFASGNSVPVLLSFGFNALLFFSLRPKLDTMLTPSGFHHSLALGTLLWTTLGWRGWSVCVVYLFLGAVVTRVGFAEKEARGIAEGRGGRRGPENVWGSALTGSLCALSAARARASGGAVLGLSPAVWLLGYAASLATKLADTFASEVGKAYGKNAFLITTLARVPPGTEGAVSLEGTAAATLGGLLLSLFAGGAGLVPGALGVGIATLAAVVATMVESLIGATLQGGWMTNEVVNFFNTLIGAVLAMSIGVLALGM